MKYFYLDCQLISKCMHIIISIYQPFDKIIFFENLNLGCKGITRVMYFHVLIMISLGGGTFAANSTLERSFAGVNATMFNEVVMTVEGFLTYIASKFLITMMFSSMSQIIIFSNKFTTTHFTCIWSNLFMSIHMILKINFTHKCFRTMLTFIWFSGTIGMNP